MYFNTGILSWPLYQFKLTGFDCIQGIVVFFLKLYIFVGKIYRNTFRIRAWERINSLCIISNGKTWFRVRTHSGNGLSTRHYCNEYFILEFCLVESSIKSHSPKYQFVLEVLKTSKVLKTCEIRKKILFHLSLLSVFWLHLWDKSGDVVTLVSEKNYFRHVILLCWVDVYSDNTRTCSTRVMLNTTVPY